MIPFILYVPRILFGILDEVSSLGHRYTPSSGVTSRLWKYAIIRVSTKWMLFGERAKKGHFSFGSSSSYAFLIKEFLPGWTKLGRSGWVTQSHLFSLAILSIGTTFKTNKINSRVGKLTKIVIIFTVTQHRPHFLQHFYFSLRCFRMNSE